MYYWADRNVVLTKIDLIKGVVPCCTIQLLFLFVAIVADAFGFTSVAGTAT
jgi:hypothetical protein